MKGRKTDPLIIQQNVALDRTRVQKNRIIQDINQAKTIGKRGGEDGKAWPHCVRNSYNRYVFIAYFIIQIQLES